MARAPASIANSASLRGAGTLAGPAAFRAAANPASNVDGLRTRTFLALANASNVVTLNGEVVTVNGIPVTV